MPLPFENKRKSINCLSFYWNEKQTRRQKIEQKASLALYKYYTLRILWKKQNLEFNVFQLCCAHSCVPNDTEWMLRESDSEVKFKMDGRLRRFADEANSIDVADPERKGKGAAAFFPAAASKGMIPLFLPEIAISEQRGDLQPTLDMFAFGSALRGSSSIHVLWIRERSHSSSLLELRRSQLPDLFPRPRAQQAGQTG